MTEKKTTKPQTSQGQTNPPDKQASGPDQYTDKGVLREQQGQQGYQDQRQGYDQRGPAPQDGGAPGVIQQGYQQGQPAPQGPQFQVGLSDEQQQAENERLARARDEYATREASNNPATAKYRDYSQIEQPGLHPGNQPDPESKIRKGTRLDLEDLTGNPGHRGINPDAPANSINPAPNRDLERVDSINEPRDVEPPPRAQVLGLDTVTPGSINEPPGSNVLPPPPDVPNPEETKTQPDQTGPTWSPLGYGGV